MSHAWLSPPGHWGQNGFTPGTLSAFWPAVKFLKRAGGLLNLGVTRILSPTLIPQIQLHPLENSGALSSNYIWILVTSLHPDPIHRPEPGGPGDSKRLPFTRFPALLDSAARDSRPLLCFKPHTAPSQSARLTVPTSPTSSAARPSLVSSRLPSPHQPPSHCLDTPRGCHLRALARAVPSDSHRASFFSVHVDAPSLEKPNTLMKLIFPISFFLFPLLFPRST